MAKLISKTQPNPVSESDQVFDLAAELFRVMSAPLRLKIISSLCDNEKNVSELLMILSRSGADITRNSSAARSNTWSDSETGLDCVFEISFAMG